MEIWKDIQNYEGLYEISSLGRIRNNLGKIKKPCVQNKGYLLVSLYKDAKEKKFLVHRLVAEHFIDNPNKYCQVNHVDGNKFNNNVINLEWYNQRLNYNHGMKNFLYSHNDEHFFAKLSNTQVRVIPELFKLGFTRSTIAKILNVHTSSIEAIEKGISYRELNLNFNFTKTKYKDLPNIKIPSYIWDIFKDNTVLNTLIAEGKVSV